MGQFHLAIRDYDKALRLDPKSVLGYLTWGLALNALDQHMQAVENYDQAGRALAHAALGNEAEAQQDTDRAVELGAK